MFVAGVDFGKAVFGSGGQMESIGSAQKGGGWSRGKDLLDAVENGLSEGEKLEVSRSGIGLYLGNRQLLFGWSCEAFTNLSKCGRSILGPAMGSDAEDIDRRCMGADFIGTALDALKLEEIVGVVVGLAHRALRSSVMI